MLGSLLKTAELEHVRVHDLRHTGAMFLKTHDASDREVMEQLGHSSIGVTMNIYAHVLDDSKQEMSSRMDRFLSED
ncbi:hypothetical protein GCM10027174_25330 [Salinifilum aidingensis]